MKKVIEYNNKHYQIYLDVERVGNRKFQLQYCIIPCKYDTDTDMILFSPYVDPTFFAYVGDVVGTTTKCFKNISKYEFLLNENTIQEKILPYINLNVAGGYRYKIQSTIDNVIFDEMDSKTAC